MTILCRTCNTEHDNKKKLSWHVRIEHSMTVQHYYDTFYRKAGEGSCQVCDAPTKYVDLDSGYKRTCGHKCGAILHRRALKADPVKYAAFVNKVRDNVSDMHATMTPDEVKRRIDKMNAAQRPPEVSRAHLEWLCSEQSLQDMDRGMYGVW